MGVKDNRAVDGLQRPVIVRQLAETTVEPFMNYSVSSDGTEQKDYKISAACAMVWPTPRFIGMWEGMNAFGPRLLNKSGLEFAR